MTRQLKKLIDDLGKLSEEEQDAIALMIREELAWKSSLEKPSKKIAKLAQEALSEHRDGKTKSDDW